MLVDPLENVSFHPFYTLFFFFTFLTEKDVEIHNILFQSGIWIPVNVDHGGL